MKAKKILFYSWLFLSLLNPSVLLAAETEGQNTNNTGRGEQEELLMFFEEEALVSIATLHPNRTGEAPAIISVITAEQIKYMGARNLADVLVTVPGIGILTSNAWSRDEIEVRGIETRQSDKVLVLVDGHRLNDPFFGGATTVTDDFPLANVKQIEIIRGPGSALYGANAFVAVINIISKKAEEIDGMQLSLGMGSFQTTRYNIMFGKILESGLKLSGNLNYFKTDGQKHLVEDDALTQLNKTSEAPGFTNNWRERSDFLLNLDYEDIGFMARFINKEHGALVGARDQLSDDEIMKFNAFDSELRLKHAITKQIEISNKIYYDLFDIDFLFETAPEGTSTPGGTFTNGAIVKSTATEQTVGDDLHLDIELFKGNLLTTGVVYEYISQSNVTTEANYDPSLPFAPSAPVDFQDFTEDANFNRNTDRTVVALYAQDDWRLIDQVSLTAGVRYDSYDDVGESVNPRGGLVFSPLPDMDLKFLYGEAFRVPNFEELYNQNNAAVHGDEDLDPEKLRTIEAGLEYRYEQRLRLTANYFHTEIEDLIVLGPDPTGEAILRFQNLDDARIDGVESEIRANFSTGHYAYINYSYQRAVKVKTKQRLPNTPMHRGNLGLNLALGKYVNIQPHLFLSAERVRAKGDTRDPDGEYALVNLAAIIKNFYKTLEVRANVHNLLDREYDNPASTVKLGKPTLPGDYPRNGIDFFVEASYKF
jgi:iron complex outermembrane receptor protein